MALDDNVQFGNHSSVGIPAFSSRTKVHRMACYSPITESMILKMAPTI